MNDPGAAEFSERAFRKTLLLELKRTAISKRPFILMLVSLADIPVGYNGHGPRGKAVASLASAIRDTDVVGWYRTNHVLGILYTEIGSSARLAVDSIMERVNECLACCLSAEDMKRLSMAVYLLPKKHLTKDRSKGGAAYPGFVEAHSPQESDVLPEAQSFH
ncbi:MAG: hypothetical protein WAW37_07935 [Syntrophobacteraceae bacterium]